MERKLLERMLGAGALVAALVVVGPLLLDGKSDLPGGLDNSGNSVSTDEFQTRTVTLRPRGSSGSPVGGESAPPRAASPATLLPMPAAAIPAGPPIAPLVRGAVPPAVARVADQPVAPLRSAASPSAPPVVTAGAPVAAAPGVVAQPVAAPGWAVQLGTFGERANAERLTRELAGRGFAAFVSPFNQAGKNLYRVRVGPVRERGAAEDLARKLAEAGHTGPVVAN